MKNSSLGKHLGDSLPDLLGLCSWFILIILDWYCLQELQIF